jgi:beta-phosphoglucomutase
MRINLIVFDLDGVLVDACELHYNALNKAIANIAGEQYVINRKEHVETYNGLSTKIKLQKLKEEKKLPEKYVKLIHDLKQLYTAEFIKDVQTIPHVYEALEKLSNDNYIICVASNSIRNTVCEILEKTKLAIWVDYHLSNESVALPKPYPLIYIRAMNIAGVTPKETLIVEDSDVGITAAKASGAHLLVVKSPADVTYENIVKKINSIEDF